MQIRVAMCSMLVCAGAASADLLTYNPSLGTLPQAQGWTFEGSYNAPMSVGSGQLNYGPTTVGGTTYWGHEPVNTTRFADGTVFIEAEIRLTGADFGNFSGYRRAGFTLFLSDDDGRWIIADMGDQRISLGNDDTRLSDPVAAFDLTSAFHLVRLEAGPTGGRLLVDGIERLTLPLGGGRSGGAAGSFGEMTVLANVNMTEIRGARYVPAPTAAMALAGLAVFGARRRR